MRKGSLFSYPGARLQNCAPELSLLGQAGEPFPAGTAKPASARHGTHENNIGDARYRVSLASNSGVQADIAQRNQPSGVERVVSRLIRGLGGRPRACDPLSP
jgi:hypothetical protein